MTCTSRRRGRIFLALYFVMPRRRRRSFGGRSSSFEMSRRMWTCRNRTHQQAQRLTGIDLEAHVLDRVDRAHLARNTIPWVIGKYL